MKTAPFTRRASAALACSAALTSPAVAAGIDAGTLITNTASATYSTGGSAATVNSNTVTVLVDELLNVTVTSNDAGPVTMAGSAVLSYTVTNTGNGPEAFALTADPAVGGNPYNTVVTGLVLDSNNNGIYDQGIDTPLVNGGNSPVLAADGTQVVFVLVNAPAGVADGSVSQVRLRADAVTATGAPGTTVAGAGQGGGAAVVGTTGASGSTAGAVTASVAGVALVKSATITDPFGGTRPVPGATVSFQIVATVSGSGSAAGLVISDPVPVGTTYRAGTLRLDGASLTDAADGDAGSFASGAISVAAGNVPANSTRTVTFDVTINP